MRHPEKCTEPTNSYAFLFVLYTENNVGVLVLSMSGESQGREASYQAEESVSWKQCIICQSDDDKKGVLVQHPKLESYGLVLQAVQERANLNDGDYV
ncbi:hypothetical protein KUCAC02_031244 [Chaenocephalus aceratus]|uniref:Uncharacterized protein n=1 Tax=Chaenocephalus aceratus TaxID=36190 RepID=A0ACB9XMJ7_CHAAC|nr:hypothetical protein KUCAC02_031244 [Chaenocephalus aceratus]